MSQSSNPGSQQAIGVAFVLVVIAMLAAGFYYLSTPAPVEVAKETADTKAKEKEQALRDLKNQIDAEESKRFALSPAVKKHSLEICTSHGDWGTRACDAVAQNQVYAGMTAEQVRASWGEPRSTEYISVRRERWIYPSRSVDFENDVVSTFQQSQQPR